MKKTFLTLAAVLAVGVIAHGAADPDGAPLPKHKLPVSNDGSLVIGNCDGKSSVEIKGKKDGETLSPKEAQSVADQLMQQWQKQNPDAKWTMAQNEADPGVEKGPSFSKPAKSDVETAVGRAEEKSKQVTEQAGTYSNFSKQEQAMWVQEQDRMVQMGNEIFHSPDKLGSRTGMACAMCHPNGSNTHPETYPKFQVQLNRVAMLRDMINWCLENPVKAPLLKDDDPKMKALEAYIMSTRKGVAMAPGKH